MNVWIVAYGEAHEGVTVASICDNEAMAMRHAMRLLRDFRRWSDDEVVERTWHRPDGPAMTRRVWEIGSDFVSVREVKVNQFRSRSAGDR